LCTISAEFGRITVCTSNVSG